MNEGADQRSSQSEAQKPSTEQLASLTWALYALRNLADLRYLYPNDTGSADALGLYRQLSQIVQSLLEHQSLQFLKKFYNPPEFTGVPVPDSLKILPDSVFSLIYDRIDGRDIRALSEDERGVAINSVRAKALDYIPAKLKDIISRVDEISLYDCRIPNPSGSEEYRSRKRMLFLLTKYWPLYADTAVEMYTAPLWFLPNPMLNLLLNVKARCTQCAEALGDEELLHALEVFFDFPLQDMDGMLPEINPMIESVYEKIEILTLNQGHASFALTQPEQNFIDVFRQTLRNTRKRADAHFQKVMDRAEQHTIEFGILSQKNSVKPLAYQRQVETRLRGLVKRGYSKRYGNNWTDVLKAVLGDDAYREVVTRMHSEKVSDIEEICHYLQFSELYRCIAAKWDLLNSNFTGNRKKFNKLMNTVITGRTKEAHHRPEHLWPAIEKDRMRIACHDLLMMIKNPDDITPQ